MTDSSSSKIPWETYFDAHSCPKEITYFKKKTKGKLTGENKDEDEHDGGVAEVEDHGGHALHLQLGEVEVDGVDEEVERSATGSQIAPPPPSVVLRVVNS